MSKVWKVCKHCVWNIHILQQNSMVCTQSYFDFCAFDLSVVIYWVVCDNYFIIRFLQPFIIFHSGFQYQHLYIVVITVITVHNQMTLISRWYYLEIKLNIFLSCVCEIVNLYVFVCLLLLHVDTSFEWCL